ncbi:unnamed protein product [Candida verbasci]|uniref:DUF1279 domain-containing protein n=1 Tax=Candida verbasci TaxID=1227364 RepID=A0A9W4TTX3_9ASCO|nr:unnamed protein product [Candida verbasci]
MFRTTRYLPRIFRSSFKSNSTTTNSPKNSKGIKALMKEYGYPALGVYLGLSFIDLPICYIIVHSAGQEKIEYYENQVKQFFGYGLSNEELKHKQEINKIENEINQQNQPQPKTTKDSSYLHILLNQFSWTEFAIAYGLHKSLIFIRLPITAAITPTIVKVLRSWGFKIGHDKFSTTASKAKVLAQNGIKDITASSNKFGTRPGGKKWWWFF